MTEETKIKVKMKSNLHWGKTLYKADEEYEITEALYNKIKINCENLGVVDADETSGESKD